MVKQSAKNLSLSIENPLVSVIIPSYMHQNYIAECIKSIISQTYPYIELIIVDDASTDNTLVEINKLRNECEQRFHSVKIISNLKGNISTSCNTGLDMSKGEYIYIIASDDMASPNAIEKLISFLKNNPTYVLAVGDNAIIDKNGKRMGWDFERNFVPLEKAPFKTFGEFLHLYDSDIRKNFFGSYVSLLYGNYIPNGYLIKKSAIFEVGKYNSSVILEDWYMNLQLSKIGKMKFIPEILFFYRWHESNNIKNYNTTQKKILISRQIYNLEREYCKINGFFHILKRLHPDSFRNKIHFIRHKFINFLRPILYINYRKRIIILLGKRF